MDQEEEHRREGPWVELTAATIPLGEHRYVEAEGLRLLVHHVEDGYFVTSAICPHQEFTMDRCVLSGPVITCTEHGWKMDVRTGTIVEVGDDEDVLPTYPAEVRAGNVWAKLF